MKNSTLKNKSFFKEAEELKNNLKQHLHNDSHNIICSKDNRESDNSHNNPPKSSHNPHNRK